MRLICASSARSMPDGANDQDYVWFMAHDSDISRHQDVMTGRSGNWLHLQLSTVILKEAVLLLLVLTGGSQAVVLLLQRLQLTAHLLHLPHTHRQILRSSHLTTPWLSENSIAPANWAK